MIFYVIAPLRRPIAYDHFFGPHRPENFASAKPGHYAVPGTFSHRRGRVSRPAVRTAGAADLPPLCKGRWVSVNFHWKSANPEGLSSSCRQSPLNTPVVTFLSPPVDFLRDATDTWNLCRRRTLFPGRATRPLRITSSKNAPAVVDVITAGAFYRASIAGRYTYQLCSARYSEMRFCT